jgi:hypothetical protein
MGGTDRCGILFYAGSTTTGIRSWRKGYQIGEGPELAGCEPLADDLQVVFPDAGAVVSDPGKPRGDFF